MKMFFYKYLTDLAFENEEAAKVEYTKHITVVDEEPTIEEVLQFNACFMMMLNHAMENVLARTKTVHVPYEMIHATVAHSLLGKYQSTWKF